MTRPKFTPPAAGGARSKLRPREYVVNERCTNACSIGEGRLPGNMFPLVHGWYEEGLNNEAIRNRGLEMGYAMSLGAIGRHRGRHLVPRDLMHTVDELKAEQGPRRKLGDLEILEELINAGSYALADKKVRVSPEMLMKAMELKYKLTQGNVFQGFLDAVNAAMTDEPPVVEDPAAVRSSDEAAQASLQEEPPVE